MNSRWQPKCWARKALAWGFAGWLGGLAAGAMAASAACPYNAQQVGQALGMDFSAGQEEPGIGGTSCKYLSKGGGEGLSVWAIVIKPGPDQEMLRTMTAGGPKAKFEPMAGDPDSAVRVRSANEGLIDLSYRRAGHVVFLRALPAGFEPDPAKREARAGSIAKKLLTLPRLP